MVIFHSYVSLPEGSRIELDWNGLSRIESDGRQLSSRLHMFRVKTMLMSFAQRTG